MNGSGPRSGLRAARTARGWSQTDAARALAALARDRGVQAAAPASLKTQLSRWENGHARPEAPYRALLDELYDGAQLGLDPDPGDAHAGDTALSDTALVDPATRLRLRVAAAAAVDAEVVALWVDQLTTVRGLDARLGAAGAAAPVRALITQLEAVLPQLPDPPRRRAVATLLARAALLAGGQALDTGDPDTAAAHFARAGEVAELAGASPLAVDAAVGRAEALVEVGEPEAALATLDQLAALDHGAQVPAAPARLAAAAAVARAAAGDAPGARRSLATAVQLWARDTPGATPVDRSTPPDGFVVELTPAASALDPDPADLDPADLDPADLDHWRGRTLARLGDPAAAGYLDRALAAGPAGVRVRTALHAQLAGTLAAAGHAGPAAEHAATARKLALRSGSHRILRLLDGQSGPSVPSSSSAAR